MTMGHMFSMVFLLFVAGVISRKLPEYDFENSALPSEISPKSSLAQTTSRFKNGAKSLEWRWTAAQKLELDFSSKRVVTSKKAGIKIWLYLSKNLPNECLSVCVRIQETSPKRYCFPMSLDFVGWRAAWVAYEEFIGCKIHGSVRGGLRYSWNRKIDRFFLIAPPGASSKNPLHIDLLQFVEEISEATRDSIVPPLTYNHRPDIKRQSCTTCAKMSTITEIAALKRYPRKLYWRHIYRWSLKEAPNVATSVNDTKLQAINEINRRMVNWYADEGSTFTKIPHKVAPTDPFLDQRWDDLLHDFDSARRWWNKLIRKPDGNLESGLFVRNSKHGYSNTNGGSKKFSDIFFKVLHPLAMEYHIKSRPIEVNHAARIIAEKYSCSPVLNVKNEDFEAITGKDSVGKNIFYSEYKRPLASSSSPNHVSCPEVTETCFSHVVHAIKELNKYRKGKILDIFTYIKDQGWQKGSALGSMDHALQEMSGFAHSVFLMKNELKTAGQLDGVIAAMKWYMEFGEVYQTPFDYQGSSADRIRTVMLFRLMTVLIMPEDNDVQKKEKIRDMDALKLWIENALTISEGLSDFIKPDFTTYYNGSFSADELPLALHTAALISYLLDETAYQLKRNKKQNLINALKVYRIAAVLYSTHSEIGGQNPQHDRAILAEHVPAFAYLAIKSPFRNNIHSNSPDLEINTEEVGMFLRLYEHTTGSDVCVGKLNEHLCDGKIHRKYYLSTLGSLQIMNKVKALAINKTAEESPSGHWSKQFASLSIHRRGDWAVTVKGFDKYVVDFDYSYNYPVGNLYGMYSSNGAMLIANSESALSSKDVDKGWDWRKIPGTTVINVPFSEMRIKSSRHYNLLPNAMAGGVSFKGSKTSDKRNGVFGMNFKQPKYTVERNSFFDKNLNFVFKKSVFFYDDLIVSLGSDIECSKMNHEVHTTLFQDLMPQTTTPKTESEPNVFRCNDGGYLNQTSWQSQPLVTLVDTNGNRYYIPRPDIQGLVLIRNHKQDSVKGNKRPPKTTTGTYCTAWFNHSKNRSLSKSEYEYAVQVDAEPVGRQFKPILGNTSYSVMKKTSKAHVVKFPANSKRGTVYGYVNYEYSKTHFVKYGPLAFANGPSVIMTEETTNPEKLYIGINFPLLNLQKKPGSPAWCKIRKIKPKTSNDVDLASLFCSKSTARPVYVRLRNRSKWSTNSLSVGGSSKDENKDDYLDSTGRDLKFKNLRNGDTTEVEFNGTSMIHA